MSLNTIDLDDLRNLPPSKISTYFSEAVHKIYCFAIDNLTLDDTKFDDLEIKIKQLIIIIVEKKIEISNPKERALVLLLSDMETNSFEYDDKTIYYTILFIHMFEENSYNYSEELINRAAAVFSTKPDNVNKTINYIFTMNSNLGHIILLIISRLSVSIRSKSLESILKLFSVSKLMIEDYDLIKKYFKGISIKRLKLFFPFVEKEILENISNPKFPFFSEILTLFFVKQSTFPFYQNFINNLLIKLENGNHAVYDNEDFIEGFDILLEKLGESKGITVKIIERLRKINDELESIGVDPLEPISLFLRIHIDKAPPRITTNLITKETILNRNLPKWFILSSYYIDSSKLKKVLQNNSLIKWNINCETHHYNLQKIDPKKETDLSNNRYLQQTKLIIFYLTNDNLNLINVLINYGKVLPSEIPKILVIVGVTDNDKSKLEKLFMDRTQIEKSYFFKDKSDLNQLGDKIISDFHSHIKTFLSPQYQQNKEFIGKFDILYCELCEEPKYLRKYAMKQNQNYSKHFIKREDINKPEFSVIRADYLTLEGNPIQGNFPKNVVLATSQGVKKYGFFDLQMGRREFEFDGWVCRKCLINNDQEDTPIEYIEAHRNFLIHLSPKGFFTVKDVKNSSWPMFIDWNTGYRIINWVLEYFTIYDEDLYKVTPKGWNLLLNSTTDSWSKEDILKIIPDLNVVSREFGFSLIRIGGSYDKKIVLLVRDGDESVFQEIVCHLLRNKAKKLDLQSIIPIITKDLEVISSEGVQIENRIIEYLKYGENNFRQIIEDRVIDFHMSTGIARELGLAEDVVQIFLDRLVKKGILTYVDPVGDIQDYVNTSKSVWRYRPRTNYKTSTYQS
ncbi:MAG: hypothetical protein ACXAB2_08850 [Candidatus Hodarchaeales archaeon]